MSINAMMPDLVKLDSSGLFTMSACPQPDISRAAPQRARRRHCFPALAFQARKNSPRDHPAK